MLAQSNQKCDLVKVFIRTADKKARAILLPPLIEGK